MTKKTRQALFYISVAVFFILSFLILILAFGFSYDFKKNNFVKTGSISLATNVQADVFINDKFEGKTSIVNNSFTKKRLLPGKYSLRVQGKELNKWEKEVEVKEGLVTSFNGVFLMKKELGLKKISSLEEFYKYNKRLDQEKNTDVPPEIAGEKIVDYSVFKDNYAVAWITGHEIWGVWNKDSDNQPFVKTGEKKLISRFSENLINIFWHRSGAYLLVRTDNGFAMLEVDTRGGININYIFKNLNLKDVVWYDPVQNKVFRFQNGSLTAVEL